MQMESEKLKELCFAGGWVHDLWAPIIGMLALLNFGGLGWGRSLFEFAPLPTGLFSSRGRSLI